MNTNARAKRQIENSKTRKVRTAELMNAEKVTDGTTATAALGANKRPRLIEKDFPFEQINPLAELESWRKEINRPNYHMHKWWANRLGSVFRAILLGSRLEEGEDLWAQFYGKHSFRDFVVLDPFMGSGTTVGEALKLGCRVVGCDINPVAYFQVRQALSGLHRDRVVDAFRRLEGRVAETIRSLYQSSYQGVRADLLYTFWVKVLPCPECGEESRLFSKWIFASNAYPSRKPESWAVCPECGELNQVHFEAAEAQCAHCGCHYHPQEGPAGRNEFRCEHCKKESKILKVVRDLGRPPDHRMYALMLLLPNGAKVYKKPDDEDLKRYADAARLFRHAQLPVPDDEIPAGVNTNQARAYNYLRWRDMFNDRQLYALGTMLEGILAEEDTACRDVLLLLFSGTLEFNNLFCSFKGEGTGAVRHLFSHHILKPERTPLEANPWGTIKSSGSFSTLFERRILSALEYAADPFELRVVMTGGKARGEKVTGINHQLFPVHADAYESLAAGTADVLILQGDSSSLPLPDRSVDAVVTDPPYFDNVNYSELADFFYVWLRRALHGRDPAFANTTTRSQREVQATKPEDFRRLMGGVLVESARVLRPDGIIAFTFHHSRSEAWVALVEAIEDANLQVVAAHPVKAEMSVATPKNQAKEPINLDLVIVCKRPTVGNGIRRQEIVAKALSEAREVTQRYNTSGTVLSRGDLRVILMGAFLKAHSSWLWHGQGTRNESESLIAELISWIDQIHRNQSVDAPSSVQRPSSNIPSQGTLFEPEPANASLY